MSTRNSSTGRPPERGKTIAIRKMRLADINAGLRLKQIAGWNQTRQDWLRFLALEPNGCFLAEVNGQPSATITFCRFGQVAWIGLLLVDPRHRRQGIATKLMQHVLARLDRAGVTRVRLDATPMGQPLYERLGFRPQFSVFRYGGIPVWRTTACRGFKVRDFRWPDWSSLLQLDQATSRVDRTKLLKRLLVQRDVRARVVSRNGRLRGFLIARPGCRAIQVGPVVALDHDMGRALMADTFTRFRRCPVFVDVPGSHDAAQSVVEEAGLSVVREFTRMCRGQPCQELIPHLWAGSGPEKG